jgi:hypothetical protein
MLQNIIPIKNAEYLPTSFQSTEFNLKLPKTMFDATNTILHERVCNITSPMSSNKGMFGEYHIMWENTVKWKPICLPQHKPTNTLDVTNISVVVNIA